MGYCADTLESVLEVDIDKVRKAGRKPEAIITILEGGGFEVDENGSTEDKLAFWFVGDKYRSYMEEIWNEIAAYMVSGSYIVWAGEDGCVWIDYFEDGTWEERDLPGGWLDIFRIVS